MAVTVPERELERLSDPRLGSFPLQDSDIWNMGGQASEAPQLEASWKDRADGSSFSLEEKRNGKEPRVLPPKRDEQAAISGRPVITTASPSFHISFGGAAGPPPLKQVASLQSQPVASPFAHPSVQNQCDSGSDDETYEGKSEEEAPAPAKQRGRPKKKVPETASAVVQTGAPVRGRGRPRGPSNLGKPPKANGDEPFVAETAAEKRKSKRRVDNRESARRVRQRRQEDLDVTQVKVEELVAENKRLEAYLAGVDKTKQQVNSQMEDLRKRWNQTSTDNVRLRGEVEALRQAKKEQAGPDQESSEAQPSSVAQTSNVTADTVNVPGSSIKSEPSSTGLEFLRTQSSWSDMLAKIPSSQLESGGLTLPMLGMLREMSLTKLPSMTNEDSTFRGFSGLLNDMLQ